MKKVFALLFVVLLFPGLVWGQASTTGQVSGTIIDESGNPISGVKVTISSPALQGERNVTTDSSGKFRAPFLSPGSYLVSLTAKDLQPASYTLRVGIGQTIPLDVTMVAGSGGLVENVTVFGTNSKLETTSGGENFNYTKQIDELPVVNRDIERVAELAPNISFGPTPNTLSISGAPSFDTVVMLDGAEISDPYFGSAPDVYLEEAIEEVQVLTTGVGAKYGRFQGGVINAVTKSGGNTFDGTVRIDLEKESWNSTTPAGESQSDELEKVYSATFGGPIVKDRLWFFLGGRTIPTQPTSRQTALSQLDFERESNEDRFQVKATGSVTSNHTIEASYLKFDASTTNRDGLPAADLRALGQRDDPREIYTGEYQGILSDSMFFNVQATKKDAAILSGPSAVDGRSPFLDFYGSGFQIWNNHWWDYNDQIERNNETISASLTKVLTTGTWGDHTIEGGVSYVNSITGGENRQSATGFNLLTYDSLVTGNNFSDVDVLDDFGDRVGDPLDPRFNLISYYDAGLTYRWIALPLGGDQQLKNTALYVQDTWQKDKWRVDAGLRWEKYKGEGPQPSFDLDFNDIAPRLGLTYNIDPSWQLQASWGRYVSRFNDNVASSITGVGGAPYVVQLYTGPTTCALNTDPTIMQDYTFCLDYDDVEAILRDDDNWDITTTVTDTSQPTRFLRDGIEAPYANDLNVGIKKALPGNTGTVTVNYTNRRYRGLLTDFVGGLGTVTVIDPLGSGLMIDLDRTEWGNSDIARRDYNALTATFSYQPSAAWNIGGNWTFSTSEGNYEGEGRNTPASGSIIGTYPDSVTLAAAIPYGYTDDDIRHRIRTWGAYTFDFGRSGTLNLGSIGTYQSGLPYNRSGSLAFADSPDYLNDQGSYTYFTDGRGNNRFNGFWRVDFTARYQVVVAKDISAYIKLDVINLTNNDSLTAFNTSGSVGPNMDTGVIEFVPSASFGTPRNDLDYQQPRSWFVSLGGQW